MNKEFGTVVFEILLSAYSAINNRKITFNGIIYMYTYDVFKVYRKFVIVLLADRRIPTDAAKAFSARLLGEDAQGNPAKED